MNLKNVCLLAACCVLWLLAPAARAVEGQEVTCYKVLDNGPDGKRKTILVLGEGYSIADKEKYHADVEHTVMQGALAHDAFKANLKGFNVYRIDVWSKESGVSHVKGPQKKTFFGLKVIDFGLAEFGKMLTGGGAGKYFEVDDAFFDTLERAEHLFGHADVVVLVLNDPTSQGCTYGQHFIVAGQGYDWRLMCHEMGHALGNLWDEYSYPNRPYKGEARNFLNSSTLPDRVNIAWSGYLPAILKVPTPEGKGAPEVGIFAGGATYDSGIYHPGLTCRMADHTTSSFCKVCAGYFETMLNQWLPNPKPLPYQNEIPKNFDINKLRGYTNFGFTLHKSDLLYDYGVNKFTPQKGTFVQNCYYPIGNFVVESYQKDGKLRTAQFLGNPFLLHLGFTANKKSVELSKELDQGRAYFNLPYESKDDVVSKGLGIRIYRMKPQDFSEKPETTRASFIGGPSMFPVVPPVKPVVKSKVTAPVGKEKAVPVKKFVISGASQDKLSYPMVMYPEKLDELNAAKRVELIADIKPEKLAEMLQKFKAGKLQAVNE